MDRYTTTLRGHKNLMFSGIRLEQGWYNQGACSASHVSFCSSPHEFAVSLSQFNIWNLGFLSSKLAEIEGGGVPASCALTSWGLSRGDLILRQAAIAYSVQRNKSPLVCRAVGGF